MREGWTVKKLGDVCTIGDGNYSSKYPKASEFTFKGIPFLTATNLKNGIIISDGLRYITKEQHLTLLKGHVKKNDLVIVVRGSSTGNNSIVSEKYAGSNLNSQLAFLRVKDETLDSEFLFQVFNSPDVQEIVINSISGAAQPQLPNNKLLDIKIPVPPLSEQKRIVKVLDKAFAAIDKAKANVEKNLQNARELSENYLQNIVEDLRINCPISTLANYLELITYGFTNPMPTADHGPYMVTAKDVKNGIINYSTARKTTQKAFDSLLTDKSRPQKGDVLVTKDGTLGRLAVVEDANLCINQSVALLRPNNKIDSHYLKNLLSSKYYQDLMIAQAGGATIKHIYITRVDKMLVPTPSIDVQKEIVKKIDIVSSKVKRLEASYQQKIRRLDELKKSILEKAFSGQLTASTKTLIHE